MSLETIRKVVSMWRAAENRKGGVSSKQERNLHWEAILIKWTYGRTHRPISMDLLNTWHHHLSFLPSSYFSPAIIFPPSSAASPTLCLRFASHKKPFSCSSIPFSTFCFLTPIPSFPPSCLGGTVLWRNLICNFYMRNQSHTSGSIGLAIYRPGRLMQ